MRNHEFMGLEPGQTVMRKTADTPFPREVEIVRDTTRFSPFGAKIREKLVKMRIGIQPVFLTVTAEDTDFIETCYPIW